MVHGLGVPSLGCPREVCLAWRRLTRRCDETRPNSWARKEKDCCGGACGGVDGRRARRSLNAVFARRRRSHAGYSGAPPRRRRQQLIGRCRPTAISGCAGARYRRPSCQKPAGGSSRRDPTQTNLRRHSIRGCERAMAARRTLNRRLDPGLVGPRQPRVSDDRHTEVVDGAGRWRERRRDCSKARGGEEAGRAGCGSKARRG